MSLLKRWAGLGLAIFAALSLVATLLGLVLIWGARAPLARSLTAGLGLVSTTLQTTADALDVASQGLTTAEQSILTLQQTTEAVAAAVGETQPSVDDVAGLLRDDFPTSVNAARLALDAVAASGALVDRVMTALSQIPFLNIAYRPEMPLDQAVGKVGESLADLPATLGAIGENLRSSSTGLAQVSGGLNTLSQGIGEFRGTITDAREVTTQYRAQIDRYTNLVASLRRILPWALTGAALLMSLMLVWLGIFQVWVCLTGWSWWRAAGEPR
jgi:ABC-type transporter Mla subunit MlaD